MDVPVFVPPEMLARLRTAAAGTVIHADANREYIPGPTSRHSATLLELGEAMGLVVGGRWVGPTRGGDDVRPDFVREG